MKVILSKNTNTKVTITNFNELTIPQKKWFMKADLKAEATVTKQGKAVLHLTATKVRPNLKRIIYGPSQEMINYFLPKSQSVLDTNQVVGGLEELWIEHKQEQRLFDRALFVNQTA